MSLNASHQAGGKADPLNDNYDGGLVAATYNVIVYYLYFQKTKVNGSAYHFRNNFMRLH